MTILTDDLIEKAAIAMRNRPPGSYSDNLGYYRLHAIAALGVILPELIIPLEKCQRALAMLVDPANIAVTTPIQAFATAHEAEVTARNAIAAINARISQLEKDLG